MSERPDKAEEMAAGAPGSALARRNGCRCPLMDNHYGRGYMGLAGIYVMTEDCPIHGAKVTANEG